MSGGQCYIIYPREIPVRPLVCQVLDYGGYLAADKILDFLDIRYPMSYLIEIAKGILPNDLTDEFAMMVEWNHKLEKEHKELAKVELPEEILLDLEKIRLQHLRKTSRKVSHFLFNPYLKCKIV